MTKNYYNLNAMWSKNRFFNMVFGARSIGKTFTTMLKLIREGVFKDKMTIYLRRYEADLDDLDKDKFINAELISHAFKDVEILEHEADVKRVVIKFTSSELGEDVHTIRIQSKKVFYDDKIIFYLKALSKFNKLKGSSYDNVYYVLMDEMLIDTDSTQHYLRGEVDALLNALYSIFRDRKGTKFIGLSNSTSYNNPYFSFFNFMGDNSQEFYYLFDNAVLLQFPRNSPLDNISPDEELPPFFRILQHSKTYNSVVSNSFVVDKDKSIRKIKTRKHFICNFKATTISIRCFSIDGGYYFDLGTGDGYTFVLNYDMIKTDRDRLLNEYASFAARLKSYYLKNKLYYADITAKYEINEFIKKLF